MSSYGGRHAELYDLFYAHKPYDEEARFVASKLRSLGLEGRSRILELGCGTGRHARELFEQGFEVLGIDYSPDMLAQAQARQTAGLRFELQDMRALDLRGESFEAAVSFFDSVGYVANNEGLDQVFRGVASHLVRGGFWVFEFWHAAPMLTSYEPVRVRRWETPTGSILRISETSLDCVRQLARVDYSIYELATDGTYRALRETQFNRYFLVQEMEGWLTRHSFRCLDWLPGFGEGPVGAETWHIVAVAQKV